MKKQVTSNHRRANNILSVIAVLMAIYIIALPVLPQLSWWGGHLFHKPDPAVVQVTQESNTPSQPIPSGMWLDIPRISLHEQIYTGLSIYELNKGVWHIPNTSTPDKGSNTVVAGHRFTYTSPKGIFYFLDKMQKDDRVTVGWQGTEYTYKVDDIKIVPPTDVSVQAPTKDNRFTFYTCTPLWTAQNRLIVQAELVSKRST
jgi:sortase A